MWLFNCNHIYHICTACKWHMLHNYCSWQSCWDETYSARYTVVVGIRTLLAPGEHIFIDFIIVIQYNILMSIHDVVLLYTSFLKLIRITCIICGIDEHILELFILLLVMHFPQNKDKPTIVCVDLPQLVRLANIYLPHQCDIFIFNIIFTSIIYL